jgi:zinc transporter ZupT
MLLYAIGRLAGAANGGSAGSPALLAAGAGVVAVATLAGAWLVRRPGDRQQVWFGAAAGVLLVIALMHLLPDAWAGARAAGVPTWLVPVVAVASFAVNIAVSRAGCACAADEQHASGGSSAAALALHRFLEGAALALAGLVTAAALAVHAFGEGAAVGALLRAQPRRLAAWLTVMCLGPAGGAVAADAIPALDIAEPLLLAIAAGVLAQAARISLHAAFRQAPSGWRLAITPAAAVVVSASLTALAVYGAG